MTPEQMKEKAVTIFQNYFVCSQAVLAAGQESLGIEGDQLFRAMGAFGGGLGRNGEICGAVVGALAVLGLRYGRGPGDEEVMNPPVYRVTEEILRRFSEEISGGKILCRDIAKVDWTDPEQVQAFRTSEQRRACTALVGETARLLGEILSRP